MRPLAHPGDLWQPRIRRKLPKMSIFLALQRPKMSMFWASQRPKMILRGKLEGLIPRSAYSVACIIIFFLSTFFPIE